ncbi:MAG: cytochrome c oxidase assembly protein [Thermomicrobiales bacterium]|nr:cytochrome c oxidase assembly protein [Thermomicrobiales bacterium]
MFQFFRGPLLHAGGVDPTGWLWSDWNIEPTIAIGLLAMLAGYLYLTRDTGEPNPDRITTSKQKASFIGGIVTLFVALGPPLDDWSDHYLLLGHMVQHLLLIMLAAPLLMAGTPAWMLEPLTRNRITNTAGYWLTRPVVAYALANFVLVFWHMPPFYDAALLSQPIHVLEHATFIGTAVLAWWPLAGPLPQWPRLQSPLLQGLYLFAMTIPGSGVGAFITLAEPGLYEPYVTSPRIFGIDLTTDQQLAGILMWIVVSSIYLLLITIIFFRWANPEEQKDRPSRQTPSPTAPVRPDAPVAR